MNDFHLLNFGVTDDGIYGWFGESMAAVGNVSFTCCKKWDSCKVEKDQSTSEDKLRGNRIILLICVNFWSKTFVGDLEWNVMLEGSESWNDFLVKLLEVVHKKTKNS